MDFWQNFVVQFGDALKTIDAFLWGPPLLILLFGTHLFFTIRLCFIQRHLGKALKIITLRDRETKGDVSAFAALAVALASTIGTGNIVGVATAVTLGGPGAVFWCMFAGILGMATKYAESLLAVKYRERGADGSTHGGPMYTMLNGVKSRFMAIIFAVTASVAVIGTGNMVQSNAMAVVVKHTFDIPSWVTGVVVAILLALVILGGLQSIARVCTCLVPFMSVVYLAGCIILLWINRAVLGEAVVMIIDNAFSLKAVGGGAAGYAFLLAARFGIARGLFSNEAGMGSEPIVAACAKTRNSVRQGLVSYTGTFCTIIICAMTGLVLVSGLAANPDTISLGDTNDILTQRCFEQIPYVGKYILAFGIFAFSITTVLGWFYYGQECLRFLIDKPSVLFAYKVFYVALTFVGAVSVLSMVWDFANIANGLMVIPNVISLLLLHKVVTAETKKYLWDKRLDDYDPELK